jgi:sarcosine oxidase delta subunit
MAKVYVYVIDRDFGFAPNPFHGTCTLATCKPRIRSVARAGDWIVGVGGSALKATGRCIYFMQVTGSLTFNEYWSHPDFKAKRPARNGSRMAMLGDNIYHRENDEDLWTQENSHHSNEDGTPEWFNVENDTGTDRVLFSNKFVYFGRHRPSLTRSTTRTVAITVPSSTGSAGLCWTGWKKREEGTGILCSPIPTSSRTVLLATPSRRTK